MILLAYLVLFFGENHVKHVTNAAIPEGKALQWKLVEQWRVNPDLIDRDELIWVGPNVTLDVDNRGHVFVLDENENRIVELDKDGRFIRLIGGKGQGPGEFSALTSLQIFPDGLMTFERQEGVAVLNYFDDRYEFKKRQSLTSPGIILSARLSPDKRLISSETMFIDVKGRRETKRLVSDLNMKTIVEVLAIESPPLKREKLFEPSYWSTFLAEVFKPFAKGQFGFAVFGPGNEIYTAVSNSYEITRWDIKGKKALVFDKQYQPIPLTEKEVASIIDPIREKIMSQLPPEIQQLISEKVVQRAVELADFPRYKHPIFNLVSHDDGKIMVVHDFHYASGKATADFFDPDGHYLGSLSHPHFGIYSGFTNRMVIKSNFVYTIETLDGVNQAVCYKIEDYE